MRFVALIFGVPFASCMLNVVIFGGTLLFSTLDFYEKFSMFSALCASTILTVTVAQSVVILELIMPQREAGSFLHFSLKATAIIGFLVSSSVLLLLYSLLENQAAFLMASPIVAGVVSIGTWSIVLFKLLNQPERNPELGRYRVAGICFSSSWIAIGTLLVALAFY